VTIQVRERARPILIGGISSLTLVEVVFWAFWGLVIWMMPALNLDPNQARRLPPTGVPPEAIAVQALAAAHLVVLGALLVRRGQLSQLLLGGLQVVDVIVIGYVAVQVALNGHTDGLIIMAYGFVPAGVVMLLWLLDRSRRAC
jgi:hypothetical protein